MERVDTENHCDMCQRFDPVTHLYDCDGDGNILSLWVCQPCVVGCFEAVGMPRKACDQLCDPLNRDPCNVCTPDMPTRGRSPGRGMKSKLDPDVRTGVPCDGCYDRPMFVVGLSTHYGLISLCEHCLEDALNTARAGRELCNQGS